jgi:pyrroloquinoline quinone biosynthesis protein B
MHIKVLGSAAGGGFPQWNCSCSNCSRVRQGTFPGKPRTQTQVALSPDDSTWFLLGASPDLRSQLTTAQEFIPKAGSRDTPIVGILLTSADVDAVMGLLHLREFQPLRVFTTRAVRRILTEENSLFHVLDRSSPPVRWEELPLDRIFPLVTQSAAGPKSNLFVKAVPLGGMFPDYVSENLRRSLAEEEAVIGLQFIQKEKRFFYAPSLLGGGEDWKRRVAESELALLDGTFWTDDELAKVLRGGKSAREMGHLPLSGARGLLNQLPRTAKTRRVLIHLNNTNPVLDESSAEYKAVRAAGWEVAYDGMDMTL